MRNNKNNITFNVKNIILFLRNLIGHFTGERKIITSSFEIITLYSLILTLSSINITNTFTYVPSASALNYQNNVGINFTFNPTLSVSISSDLVIPNLTPGTTDTSNEISVNVSTNNVYGYNLYATVGNETYNNTNFTHTNNTDVFSSISTTANLPTLTTDNTWGYTHSLDHGTTWSNYNGLPLYTTDSPTRLKKNTGPSNDTINFKIAAKAGNTQPSGTYANIINFTAITKQAPLSLAESYEAYYQKTGKTKLNGYYIMQDMNPEICDNAEIVDTELQVIDNRDHKVYWIAKLKDNHCWMTQNLDLDLTSDPTADNYIALTSENTDLNDTTSPAYQDGYTINEDGIITWLPERDTIFGAVSDGMVTIPGWRSDGANPYSGDIGEYYVKNDIGAHGLVGNYYNWAAVTASNSLESNFYQYENAPNSICPRGWRLSTGAPISEFGNMLVSYDVIKSYNPVNGYKNGWYSIISEGPLYIIRSGYTIGGLAKYGYYWTSTSSNGSKRYMVGIGDYIYAIRSEYGSSGYVVRCLAR